MKLQSAKPFAQGFTLIELAVVLTIIGILAGSIIMGRSMIRQSQVNSAQIDAQKYAAAAVTFQQRYNYLPGDMPTATSYWSATTNGSGNGQIAESASYNYEMFTFWQQLGLARLIDGNFSGTAGTAGSADHVIGTNCPAGKMESTGFGAAYVGVKSGDANFFNNTYGHVLIFGSYASNNLPVTAALSGGEAQSIDAKYDDGAPATGQIETWMPTTGYTPNCAVVNNGAYIYNISGSAPACSMIFITGF